MKQAQVFSGIIMGGAAALLATQPSFAAATQVTAVRLNESGSELRLILETKGDGELPQVYTVNSGKDLVADIANTQLNLQEGDSFRQENPLPGITALVVSQSDANSVRVTVTGAQNSPTGQIIQTERQGITLGISPATKSQAADPIAVSSSADTSILPTNPNIPALKAPTTSLPQKQSTPTTVAQTPQSVTPEQKPSVQTLAQTPQSVTPEQRPSVPTLVQAPQPVAPGQTPTAPDPTIPTVVQPPTIPAPAPDVLVPNPRITIDGNPAPAAGAVQPIAPAPPFLPRAIAPPLGDIAISNINASSSFIDLGTAVRVPRLVLREAPVREVLSLLARSAGLNIAYIGEGGAGGAGGAPGGAPAAGGQRTISLDLENEPVQNVFNYVLQISNLQANRVGNTILVGAQLPDVARNLVARTLRLNQVTAVQASNYLISQGAEQQQLVTSTTITVVGEGAAAQRIQNTQTTVQKLAPQETAAGGGQGGTGQTGALVLRGLLVAPDQRLNAVTLIGEPRKVEIATAFLNQLDLRRRQVAINVKIVDVNLLGLDAFNSSFSFGIGNAFFVNDGGAASFNYGGFRPPTSTQVAGSQVSPAVIANPFAGATTFFDPTSTVGTVPGTGVDTITVFNDPARGIFNFDRQPGRDASAFVTRAGVSTDPLTAGLTSFTLGTPTVFSTTVTPATPPTFDANGNITSPGTPETSTTTVTQGTPGTITSALPSLFQFPKRLLTALQAQITSGNAKILTDPTLVVQEGQTAQVNLTQEVVGNITSETQSSGNETTRTVTAQIREAGLILAIAVDRIDDNGFINLAVNPRVTSIGSTQNLSTGNDTNQIALLNVRQLASGQIRLRDGQTLILSGIIQESDRTTVRKVPILGDIPILGALFRSTERSNQRQEVIVLLTPQIIDDSEGSSFGYNYTPGREARQIMQRGNPSGGNQ